MTKVTIPCNPSEGGGGTDLTAILTDDCQNQPAMRVTDPCAVDAANNNTQQIKAAVDALLPELQAINANTDGLESALASIDATAAAILSEQNVELVISTTEVCVDDGTDKKTCTERTVVLWNSETASELGRTVEYRTDGLSWSATPPTGTITAGACAIKELPAPIATAEHEMELLTGVYTYEQLRTRLFSSGKVTTDVDLSKHEWFSIFLAPDEGSSFSYATDGAAAVTRTTSVGYTGNSTADGSMLEPLNGFVVNVSGRVVLSTKIFTGTRDVEVPVEPLNYIYFGQPVTNGIVTDLASFEAELLKFVDAPGGLLNTTFDPATGRGTFDNADWVLRDVESGYEIDVKGVNLLRCVQITGGPHIGLRGSFDGSVGVSLTMPSLNAIDVAIVQEDQPLFTVTQSDGLKEVITPTLTTLTNSEDTGQVWVSDPLWNENFNFIGDFVWRVPTALVTNPQLAQLDAMLHASVEGVA